MKRGRHNGAGRSNETRRASRGADAKVDAVQKRPPTYNKACPLTRLAHCRFEQLKYLTNLFLCIFPVPCNDASLAAMVPLIRLPTRIIDEMK